MTSRLRLDIRVVCGEDLHRASPSPVAARSGGCPPYLENLAALLPSRAGRLLAGAPVRPPSC